MRLRNIRRSIGTALLLCAVCIFVGDEQLCKSIDMCDALECACVAIGLRFIKPCIYKDLPKSSRTVSDFC